MKLKESIKTEILLIDDELSVIDIMREVLTDEGYEVYIASEGTQGIEIAKNKIPDLILLDVQMPGIDGFEVCARLKTDPDLKEIPVIFMSGLAEPFDKARGFNIGGVDYLTKPIDNVELLARLNTHLSINRLLNELKKTNIDLEDKIEKRTEELKNKNKTLKVSEERFKKLSALTFEGIVIHREGVAIDVNMSLAKMFGYELDYFIGKNVIKLMVPEKHHPIISENLKKNYALPYEIEGIRKDGSIFPIEVQAKDYKEEDADYRVAVVRDVTRQKKAEEALIDSEERYRTIFQESVDAIMVLNENEFLDCNRAALSLFGYNNKDDFIGRKPSEISPPVQPDGVDSVTAAIAKINEAYNCGNNYFEWVHRRADGTDFYAEVSLTSFKYREKLCLQAIVRDITDRKEAENKLFEEKVFSETVINSLPGIFYVYDEDMRLIKWNKNFEVISEFTPEELYHKNALSFIAEEDKEKVTEAISKALETGESSAEAYLIFKNGKKIPFLLTGKLMVTGEQRFLIGTGIDISTAKKIEMELRQAQKMEAVGNLAGGIAHDFNNILSVIFGFSELAKKKVKDDLKLTKYLSEIQNAGLRARDLVRQILTFSRRTEQKIKLMQISPIIEEAVKMLRSSIPATIEIKHDIQSRGAVMADSTQIHQVIMNLCTNAYHAMRETGGTLAVSLTDVEIDRENIPGLSIKPGAYIMIKVSDSGHGMDEETKKKIFEPFFTTKEPGEGTGLGLAVVHGIVESHKGYLSLYSEPGLGTSFHIYFPLCKKHAEVHDFEQDKEPVKGGNEKIMFVDDEISIINFARESLTEYGYKVTTFTNGVQALQDFQAQPDQYDIIITDMTMPYMTGAKLAQKVIEIRADVPVILCTGYSELIYREKAMAMGISEYCEKPIMMNVLLRKVRQVLDNIKSP